MVEIVPENRIRRLNAFIRLSVATSEHKKKFVFCDVNCHFLHLERTDEAGIFLLFVLYLRKNAERANALKKSVVLSTHGHFCVLGWTEDLHRLTQ